MGFSILSLDEEAIAGVTTAMVGFMGYVVSTVLMVLIMKTPSCRNAFGYLCISRLVSHIGIYSFNVFWAAPALLLKFDDSITSSYIGARIAINRLIAVASPLLYSRAFSDWNLMIFIAAFWLLSSAQSIVLLWEECKYVFSPSQFAWVYASTECGLFASFYLDFLFCVVVILTVLLIDSATFFLIRRRAKDLFNKRCSSSQEQLAKLRVHKIFFVQGILCAINQALGIASYHSLLRETATKWERIAGTTLIFQLCNIIDALILFSFIKPFREEFRRSLCRRGRKPSVNRGSKVGHTLFASRFS
ncbi:hypothetical protein Y032_0920g3045 [Ancylostoma ceylanicum]|uniref:G-protein coupled receptors family 1 profile domain-containing protein n=1 Tax=Ancylostoma ceylanicum TaxID=53326 RepID=A0A016WAB1_9BILA|nr:hypothetical protein Y032_0920g3045 [Ancylostoma ceylanicum]